MADSDGREWKERFTLQDFEAWAKKTMLKCGTCGQLLDAANFQRKQHSGGLYDLKSGNRYWLYITCPNCGYETSHENFLGMVESADKMRSKSNGP